jgi:hypothetical protein
VSQVEKFKEYGYTNLGVDEDGMDVMGKRFESGIFLVVVIAEDKLKGMVRLTTEQMETMKNLPESVIPK